MLIASLPWYDLPAIRDATELLWASLAANLRAGGFRNVSDSLERRVPYSQEWMSGRLLFSQDCGYDCLLPFSGHLQLVATPVYSAPECAGPHGPCGGTRRRAITRLSYP